MKQILFIVLFSILFIVSCHAQSIDKVTKRCPAPNTSSFGTILVTATGDITYVPCPTRSSIFSGIVDLSGATVVGAVTGSGTVNFMPRWTAASVLGDTPASWNGTIYKWQNTALNNTFLMEFTPSATGTGRFQIGTLTDSFIVDENTGVSVFRGTNTINAFAPLIDLGTSTRVLARYDDSAQTATIGDVSGVGNGVLFTVNDGGNTFGFTSAAAGSTFNVFAGSTAGFTIDRATTNILLGDLTGATAAYINVNSAGQFIQIDAVGGAGTIQIGHSGASLIANTVTDTLSTGLNTWNLSGVVTFNLNRTLTAGGTTGAQTINKPAGSVNFAAAATSLVVTNNTATTTSLIFVTPQTADATCTSFSVVRAAGSFTITANAACTAETAVAFWVTN